MASSTTDRLPRAGALERTLADLAAGVVCGLVATVASIGNGSLLFSHGSPLTSR